MYGPAIIARSISVRTEHDRHGNPWQYNSRSDHHSKVACWGILFDLLLTSSRLRRHAEIGEVAFGVNHSMLDFKNNKPKNLDLVICTPGTGWPKRRPHRTLIDLVSKYSIELDEKAKQALASLPAFREDAVGAVRLALEAKACMTAHQASLPRLHDELSSSHHTIHGASDSAVAVGLVMVNSSTEFLSTIRNNYPWTSAPPRVTQHKQPRATQLVMEKVKQLPRRTKPGEAGYDALGVVVVNCRNDGSSVELVSESPAPALGTNFHYDQLIHRAAQAYESRFAG
jgi:hypothetical protein